MKNSRFLFEPICENKTPQCFSLIAYDVGYRGAKIGSAGQYTKLVASSRMYAPPGGGVSNHNNRIADFQLKFCVLIRLSV